MFRKDIIFKLAGVEQQYRAAAFAVGDMLRRVTRDPTLLPSGDLVPADVRLCLENLESTYLVRLFAVFEEALRDVRRLVYGKAGAGKTYDLLQQCAARQHMPSDLLASAHKVRDFRNSVVHGGSAQLVALAQARAWLCTFMGRMPSRW